MQVSHLIHIMMTNYDIKNCIISITMILSGQLSNFNIIHLLFNSSLICIGIVLIDLETINLFIKKSKSIYLICLDEYKILKDIAIVKINKYYNNPINENGIIIKEKSESQQIQLTGSRNDTPIKLNEQRVISHIDVLELSNEVGIDSQVFDLPKEEFIEAISMNEDVDININDSNISERSIKKSTMSSKQSMPSLTNSDMHLLDNYY